MLAISAMRCPLLCVLYATAYMIENTAIVIGMYTLPFSEGKWNGLGRYLHILLHRPCGDIVVSISVVSSLGLNPMPHIGGGNSLLSRVRVQLYTFIDSTEKRTAVEA